MTNENFGERGGPEIRFLMSANWVVMHHAMDFSLP